MILPASTLVLMIVLLIVVIFTLLHHAQAQRGLHMAERRPLPALDLVRRALARGAETGNAIHLSPGSGGVDLRPGAAETIVGLLVTERVAQEAALTGAPILVGVGDAVSYLALQGAVRRAYERAGAAEEHDPGRIQLLAHQDPMGYALGVNSVYGRQPVEVSQMIGSFGQEFVLIGETGAARGIPQIAGTANATAQPLTYLAADEALIGEEIFAAEAYLSRETTSDARLRTQDALRTVAIVTILLLTILSLSGIRPNL